MSISKKLGKNIQQISDELPVRRITVDLGEVKFDLRVRVPLKKQMEEITARILSPNPEKVEEIYQRLASPMRQTLLDGGEDFVKALNEKSKTVVMTDDDLLVDGTSVRQIAQLQAMEELKVEEYFHLLLSETNEPVTETYEQIFAEFPEFVVKEIVDAIQGAISPDYRTTKKN
jgi:hypothetical protein